ncbi:hypothetical protein PG994_005681 [Apiospora phragmitis]|uniref:Uncharacterized protein n=1 Tax=Apiospora phragmitis TaxID=2905665 RepID=A0ABR1VFQ7_9PEZI
MSEHVAVAVLSAEHLHLHVGEELLVEAQLLQQIEDVELLRVLGLLPLREPRDVGRGVADVGVLGSHQLEGRRHQRAERVPVPVRGVEDDAGHDAHPGADTAALQAVGRHGDVDAALGVRRVLAEHGGRVVGQVQVPARLAERLWVDRHHERHGRRRGGPLDAVDDLVPFEAPEVEAAPSDVALPVLRLGCEEGGGRGDAVV